MENQTYVDNSWKVIFLFFSRLLIFLIIVGLLIELKYARVENLLTFYIITATFQFILTFAPDLYLKYFKKDLFLKIRIFSWIIVLIISFLIYYTGNTFHSLVFLFNFLLFTLPSEHKYLPQKPKSS